MTHPPITAGHPWDAAGCESTTDPQMVAFNAEYDAIAAQDPASSTCTPSAGPT
ncbi:hypothetical protein [Kitasatospora sp. NPDC001527]|uniref:hypothetical protein n=1 Tax=Kitasatospora sp. NPDC001527 TaxID=3154519 RepID=UPI00331EA252